MTADLSDLELLKVWQAGQENGLTQRKLAAYLGVSFNSLHGRIFRAQKALEALEAEDGKLTVREAGQNAKEISLASAEIRNPDELVEHIQLDLTKWRVTHGEVRRWSTPAKSRQGHIRWQDGRIVEGEMVYEKEMTARTIYLVKIKIERLHPEPIKLTVQPVRITGARYEIPKPEINPSGRALVFCDPHFGFSRDLRTGELVNYHQRGVLSILLQLVERTQYDKIVLAGDLMDYAEWSLKFVRSPDMRFTTMPALVEAAWFLHQLRLANPKAEIVVLEGNHDDRPRKKLLAHFADAHGLRPVHDLDGPPLYSIPYLLGLDRMGVEYISDYPESETWVGGVRVIHGSTARKKPGHSASAVVEAAEDTTAFGHIHRIEMATKKTVGRKGARHIQAVCPGCTCWTDGRVPGSSKRDNWQNGFLDLEYDGDNLHLEPHLIENDQVLLRGCKFTADPQGYLEAMNADTDWAF
ncbi:MAG: metallophosphoesterase [Anaerolineales bacterium]|jgi:hypothetical protein